MIDKSVEKNMKILITATTYPTSSIDNQPQFVHNLAKELASSFEVHVLVPRAGDLGALNERIDGVHIIRYPYFFKKFETLAYGSGILENLKKNRWNYALIPFLVLSQWFFVIKIVRKYQIQAINAHWIIPQGIIAILAKIFLKEKPKLIITSHGADLFALNGGILKKIKSWVINKADIFTVVSMAMKNYCRKELHINNSDSIVVRSMGVDLEKLFIKKTRFEDRENVIFVGRLVEKKGLFVLIEAARILKQRKRNLKISIVGSGRLLEQLEKLVKEYQLSSFVVFLGVKSQIQIADLLNQHKVFIMPSIIGTDGDQEGLGLVAVEAMGCGCAVLVSNLAAVKDVVKDGQNGVMFEAGDSLALANNLEKLLIDDELCKRLSEVGHDFVKSEFDWSVVGNEYRRLLKLLVT